MFRKLLATASLLIACAPRAQAEGMSLSPDQLPLIDRTCSQVMGLRPGETYFAACRENLSLAAPVGNEVRPVADTGGLEAGKSFYEVSPGVRWNRERYACARIGLAPGSTAFHQCVTGLDGAFLPSLN